MHGIFAPFPYSGNFLLEHGNTCMADYDSMSFFCSVCMSKRAEGRGGGKLVDREERHPEGKVGRIN